MTLHEIQQDAVERYRIKLDPCSKCWGRMHAHVKERRICKWVPKNSVVATFDLLHEIGHCETYHGTMRRAESEYAATVWAIDRMHEYGLKVPEKVLTRYQEYINREKDRGIRRGGKGYGDYNIKP